MLRLWPAPRRVARPAHLSVRSTVNSPPDRVAPRAAELKESQQPLWALPLGKFLHRASLVALSEVGYSRCRRLYPQQVVFEERSQHGNGLVQVRQHGPWRALHFNSTEQGLSYVGLPPSGVKQVVQLWNDGAAIPYVLGFEYIRTMAATIAGFAQLQGIQMATQGTRVLCVGLGAGALPAFIAHHNPQLDVAVVDIDPVVIRAAKDVISFQFGIMHSTAELAHVAQQTPAAPFRVLEADAGAAMSELATELQATRRSRREDAAIDVLVLDAYEEHARVPNHLKAPAFLASCAACLKRDGIVVVNMLNGTPDSKARKEVVEYARLLERHFGCVYSVKVEDQQFNVILVACYPDSPIGKRIVSRGQLVEAARSVAMEQSWVFDAGDLVEKLFRCNITDVAMWEEVPGRTVDWPKESSAAGHEYVDRDPDE